MRPLSVSRQAAVTNDGVMYDPCSMEGETVIVYDEGLAASGTMMLVVQLVDAHGEVVGDELLIW